MTGHGRSQADFGGFVIPHFAHQDDVRILPQSRSEHGCEFQADFRVHLYLGDPWQAVFHRVLGGDDFHLRLVQFGQRPVQGCGFTATGRAGDQNHAVGLLDQFTEPGQQLRRHTRAFEIQGTLALIQQTHDHRLAILYGHGGYPHVNAAAFYPNVEAAILGQSFLGNIEARHELQAQDQRSIHALLFHHLFLQHTVHPLADTHNGLVRLDMNIRASGLHGIFEQGLQQFDHRRIGTFRLGRKIRQVEGVVAQFVFQFFRQGGNFISAAIHQVKRAEQLAFPHDGLLDRLFEYPNQFVVSEDVQRVRHAHQQLTAFLRQHNRPEPPGHGFG